MHKDITLTIDNALADKALKYAEQEGKTLSQIFENYLQMFVMRQEKSIIPQTPIATSLKGAVKANYDYKKALNNDLNINHLQ